MQTIDVTSTLKRRAFIFIHSSSLSSNNNHLYFQAASDSTPQPPGQSFQRHHSVRLPSTNQQNRRYTLGGDSLMIDTRLFNNSSQLQPPPVVKLRTSTTNTASTSPLTMTNPIQSDNSDFDNDKNDVSVVKVAMRDKQLRGKQFIQRRESDAYQAALRARRAGLVGSLIEKKNGQLHDSDDEPRSSPDEDIVRKRSSVVSVNTNQIPPPVKKRTSKNDKSNSEGQYQATNAVAVRKPKPAHVS